MFKSQSLEVSQLGFNPEKLAPSREGVLKVQLVLESPGGLLKGICWALHLDFPIHWTTRCQEICISNKSPHDADVAESDFENLEFKLCF